MNFDTVINHGTFDRQLHDIRGVATNAVAIFFKCHTAAKRVTPIPDRGWIKPLICIFYHKTLAASTAFAHPLFIFLVNTYTYNINYSLDQYTRVCIFFMCAFLHIDGEKYLYILFWKI